MLLCGIIDELSVRNPAYFFCQANDPRINTASAVLRGLIFLLITQHQSLSSHVRDKYEKAGKQLFEDANAWVALSGTFNEILENLSSITTYLVIDALDECSVGLKDLLQLIVESSERHPAVKWLVSSRDWPEIKERLDNTATGLSLRLELNDDSISAAVDVYIRHKVNHLAQLKKYSKDLESDVIQYLISHAGNTFLWVALVYKELMKLYSWEAKKELTKFPPGLNALYESMLERINSLRDPQLCISILATMSIVYRPIVLDELPSLAQVPSVDHKALRQMIELCGSFLTIRDSTIFFIHQSAQDFLSRETTTAKFFAEGMPNHRSVFLKSITAMSKFLRRNMYNLQHLGYISIQEVEGKKEKTAFEHDLAIQDSMDTEAIKTLERPNPDPLAPIHYACVYWIDHLCDSQDGHEDTAVGEFIQKHFLHWLEALSLLKRTSEGVLALVKLASFLQVGCRIISMRHQRLIDPENFTRVPASGFGPRYVSICLSQQNHYQKGSPASILISTSF